MNLEKRIYEKLIKINVFKKILHGIHGSNGHGEHNIIIYNIVSLNFCFVFYISHILLEFMNKFHYLNMKT